MKKKTVKKATVPFETDFYSIESCNGTKQIHIHGYIYKGEFWSFNECSFLIEPLSTFCEKYAKRKQEYINELFECARQSFFEFTPKETIECINGFFGGKPAAAVLPYEKLTSDTPEGGYLTVLPR